MSSRYLELQRQLINLSEFSTVLGVLFVLFGIGMFRVYWPEQPVDAVGAICTLWAVAAFNFFLAYRANKLSMSRIQYERFVLNS